MKYKLIILLLTFLAISCNQKETEKEVKNDSTGDFTSSDLHSKLILEQKAFESKLSFFSNNGRYQNGYCKLENDTIKIFNSVGFMTGKSISIFTNKDYLKIDLHTYSCTYNYDYIPIEQSLKLNKSNYKVNDTIIGEVYFKGAHVLNSATKNIDTITIRENFKFRIRDSDYSRDNLEQEENYQEFIELSKKRPDTIKSLSLRKCGLKKLPQELSLFKNLESLDIVDNDLRNADFRLISGLKKMKVIKIRKCNLNKIPTEILNFKLTELDLYNNQIQKLPSRLFNITSLKQLQIGNNNYSILPHQIGNLKNLEMLSLENTKVRKFPKSILQLSKLKSIYPPEYMDYFPPQLAKYLSSTFTYRGIKNIDEFKHLIPKSKW